jgi:hypothetical protein
MGGLASAMWWFLVGVAIAVAGVLLFGSSPPGWSTERVVAPLVGGWILLALLASATHLLPAVGPGTHASHRRQRELLGRAAFRRLLAANAGIVLLSVATPLGFGPGVTGGLVLLGAPFVVTAALLGGAVVVAVRAQG